MSKTCTKCGATKALDEFGPSPRGSFGRRSDCRECHRKKLREFRAANRDHLAEQRRGYYDADPEKHRRRAKDNHRRNPAAHYARVVEWKKKNPEKARRVAKNASLRRYGITVDQWDEMFAAQNGVCAICLRPPSGRGPNRFLNVDHCHATGAVRGLLCSLCNVALGRLRDDPAVVRRAAEYLERACG